MHGIDLYSIQLCVGAFLISLFFIWKQAKSLGLLPMVTWLWFVASAISVAFPLEFKFGEIYHIKFFQTACHTLFALLMVPMLALNLKKLTIWRNLVPMFISLAMTEASLVSFLGYGMLNNHSFGGVFIAILLPYMWDRRHLGKLDAAIPWIAAVWILTSNGSTAVFLLAIFVALEGLKGIRYDWREIRMAFVLITPVAVMSVFALSYHKIGMQLFTAPYRIEWWTKIMGWWWENANVWFGTGLGTYFYLGPGIQKTLEPSNPHVMLWMHNDWLQILFETGIIGLALTLAVYFKVLRRTWKVDYTSFQTLVLIGASMCAYYPLHWYLTSVFAAFVLRLGLSSNTNEQTQHHSQTCR